ncbi:S-adenosyl-L-methionine-dependent methyltransferase [Pyronema domesticum]|nr:S-adenosyl-L-methionine-dependent methyltransferase [Pyronema domesticum]
MTDILEVDPEVRRNPDDEDYASTGYDTSIASLSSSVHEYIFENGRRYHAYYGPDQYLMPQDEKEKDRLDLHHEIILQLFEGQLHQAPLQNPHRILDVGTGTGIWAIDMADKFPEAEVIGTDLSPIQSGWVPANCRFEVDDATLDWTYTDNHFDFIHGRSVGQGFDDWGKLLSEMKCCTVPGGWVEICECGIRANCDDGTMADNNACKIFIDLLRQALIKIKRPPIDDIETLRQRFEATGFEDIRIKTVKEPIGPWTRDERMKKIGAMVLLHCESVYEAYGVATFTKLLGMDRDEAKRICENAIASSRNKNYHLYSIFYNVCGRKPLE